MKFNDVNWMHISELARRSWANIEKNTLIKYPHKIKEISKHVTKKLNNHKIKFQRQPWITEK